jgi:phosphopantetheine adenylyltransferase
MNSLVKSLILPFLTEVDSLGEGSTVGLFGGGFQPPTKGHFEVVKQAIETHPNLNKFIIFVGTGGGRSDITQDQSLAIWNIYKNYLPGDIEIVASSSPLSSIYRYTKEHPFEDVKWFLGSRQGNEEDFKNFEKHSKAPSTRSNLEVINIVTPNDISGISGTEARQTLADKELLSTYLPDELESKDQDKVFNILNPMSEGEEITTWVEEEIDNEDLDIDTTGVLDDTDIVISKHVKDRAKERNINANDIELFFQHLKQDSEANDELEIDLQYNNAVASDLNKTKSKPNPTNINIPLSKIKNNQTVATTIMKGKNFTPNSAREPKIVFEKVVGNSIVCDDCGWTWKIKDGGDDLFMCHKCGHDNTPEGTNNFFEPIQDKQLDLNISSEPTRVDYYKDYYKNLSPPDFKIDKDKDKIVISNISKKGLENDKDFIEKLISLTDYMMDHISIEPLPDVNFVEDDNKNADDFFGKTAYYNPNDKSITLYTLKRHPKDVLRSFAHEMVHHKQNLEGKLQNIEGYNINEDDYLKELEREAYEYGNGLLFRGWENSIKGND